MRFISSSFLTAIISLISPGLSAAEKPAAVSFARDLAPILADKCLTCHQEKKAKGHYRLDSYAMLIKAGDSKDAALTPGKPDASALYTRLVTHEEDDRMPQKDDPLPTAQIELFQRWIADGGKFDGSDPKLALTEIMVKKEAPKAPEKYARPLPITALVWMKDGKAIATSGYHEVLLWNAETGELIKRIGNMPERVLGLSLHPDGTTLAVVGGVPGKTGEISIVNSETGELIKKLPNAKDTVLAVAFSPDGKWLAIGGTDNFVRVFNTKDWKAVWKIEAHADWVTSLASSPDSKLLVSTSRDRTARVFNATNGEVTVTQTSHSSAVTAAIFDTEGKTVISASNDGQLRRWEINTATDGSGKVKDKVLKGGRQEVTRLAVAEKQLVTASADGRMRLYDLSKEGEPRFIEAQGSRVNAIAVDATGTKIAYAGQGGKLTVLNLVDGKTLLAKITAPGW